MHIKIRNYDWKKGNGTLVFGTFLMMLCLVVCITLIQIFDINQQAVNLQNATDVIADGTAVYMKSNGGTEKDEAMEEAEKIQKLVKENMDVDIKQLSIDEDALKNKSTVKVQTAMEVPYLTKLHSDTDSTYTVRKNAATKYDGTIPSGEAAQINKDERLKYLFPSGVPTSDAEMQQYLTTISVPIISTNGVKSTMELRVHKKLESEYMAIFQEMVNIGFPVKASCTAAYSWRNMVTNTSHQSHHSYGCVVDLNYEYNPLINGANPYLGKSEYAITSKVVNIWKRHGFLWGGDWSGTKDYMHFTYTGH